MPIDFLAIALILLSASIALLFRVRSGAAASLGDEMGFARLDQMDPSVMKLPLSGLNSTGGMTFEGAFLPAELVMLLETKAEVETTSEPPETQALSLAMSPSPIPPTNALSLRLQETLAAFTILLGLVFLLFWLIAIF